jgi:hypothetical protein
MIKDLDGEVWVPIFRDYEISNMGRVLSNKRDVPIILKTYPNNRGYHIIHFRICGKRRALTVHRLVADIFLKNIDISKVTVNHERGKDDNRAESLSWMTYSENSRHGVENGMLKRGSSHYKTKLDEIQVKTIKSLNGQIKRKHIANYFKISLNNVGTIMTGKSWGHI